MKVLIFDNSSQQNGDFRLHAAFGELVHAGHIDSFRLISFGEHGSDLRRKFLAEAESLVREYRPDVLIWHKDDGQDLDELLIERIASLTRLVYHDLDAWMKWVKPVRRNQLTLSRWAHLVFLCGGGSMYELFPDAKGRLRYSPNGYCDLDIPSPSPIRNPTLTFIGSIHRRFSRFLGPFGPELQPGRTKAVRTLRRALGARFQVWGRGYPSSWNIQPCDYNSQFSIVNEALASFALDAAPNAPGFFSDRTPIALACGSIHFKIGRPGDADQFHNCHGLISVPDAATAAEQFEIALGWSENQKTEVANETREFARRHLRQPDLYRKILGEATGW